MDTLVGRARPVRVDAAHGLRAAMMILIALACGLLAERAQAQQSPSVPTDILQQLQQITGGAGTGGVGPGTMPQQTILEPSAPPNQILPTSRLEQLLSSRAGVRLRQFGYDQLGVGQAINVPQVGAVQDSYVLGPGDEIVVTLRGQENSEYRTTVDRDGMVTIPRLNPVSASGRTLGDFRRDLIAAIHRAYVSTEGFVSIGQVRQVSVLVSGEVNNPGMRLVTGLSTPVDAILVSGGIKKVGSLRNVYIIRGGHRISIDLYSVLTGSAAEHAVALSDGDRIVVPPLGPTVAVVGWVRRPGIFEMAPGRKSMTVHELLSLAGGLEVRGKYRMSVLRVAADGRNEMLTLNDDTGSVGDSDILFVQPAASRTANMATISGGTALAGQYAAGTKLSEYLKSPGALGENPYTLFGIISRRDPVTLLRTLIPFTPVAVLKGSEDMNVQSDDIVRIISTTEAQVLFTAVQQYNLQRRQTEEALRNPVAAQQGTLINGNNTQASIATALQSAAQSGGPTDLAARRALTTANDQALQAVGAGIQAGQNGIQAPSDQAQIPVGSAGTYPQFASQYPQSVPQGQQYQQYPGYQQYQQYRQYQQYQQPGVQYPLYPGQYPVQPVQQPYTQNLQEAPLIPGQVPSNIDVGSVSDLASQLRVDPLVLVNFLDDRAVNVDGAVQGPGLYLVGPDADIQSLVTAAGGLAHWADRSSVEVISTTVDSNAGKSETERRTLSLANGADAGYIVSPHDQVRVSEVFTSVGVGSVTVQGQVRHVGTYQIVRGEHLSDVLMRAGGLTDSAYPYGTVFLRRSAAERERAAFEREAKEIEDQLLLAMSRRDPNSKLSPDAFTALQSYVTQLKNQPALGRVSIAADPAVLAANPAMDPLVEPGDVIYVPQRPYSVSVLGEVLQPGSVPYRSDMSASDYIDHVGGYSQFADKSETILVLPDGSARRVESSWFDFGGGNDIPPGSTIYVARDISGLDLHQIIVDTTAIFSQLATSAAALAVLSTQIK
jgi:polysaccharide biosynthesis/export protein